MNKRKKILFAVLSIIIILSIVCITVWNKSFKRIEKVFASDYALLEKVTEYLVSLDEFPYLSIKSPNGIMRLEFGDKITILDDDAKDAISELFNRGYNYIFKRDSNTIYFERWTNWVTGENKGFAYSIDGTGDLSEIEFLVRQEALPKQNWFFIVDDYNEWRVKLKDK